MAFCGFAFGSGSLPSRYSAVFPRGVLASIGSSFGNRAVLIPEVIGTASVTDDLPKNLGNDIPIPKVMEFPNSDGVNGMAIGNAIFPAMSTPLPVIVYPASLIADDNDSSPRSNGFRPASATGCAYFSRAKRGFIGTVAGPVLYLSSDEISLIDVGNGENSLASPAALSEKVLGWTSGR